MRLLFYVQHLLGIGHVRRAAVLASALSARGFDVQVVAGGLPLDGLGFAADTRVLQLPAIKAGDAGFKTLVDDAGTPVTERLWAERRARLLDTFATTRPEVLLIEAYPFARRAFRHELDALLETAHARSNRPLVAGSVRDVLVETRKPERLEEAAAKAERYFDLVLVHGDPTVIPFERTFPLAHRLGDRVRYTGYVVAARPPVAPDGAGAGEVIVSTGGGAVGASLLRTALAARPRTALADRPWRLLCGPDLPAEERAVLASTASAGVVVEPARRDFPALLARCHLSISQAGYNTVMDLLQAGCRSVVVPFSSGKESEQELRATLLAERGLLTVVPEETLSPDTLAAGIAQALARPARPETEPGGVNLDGARATADLLARSLVAKTL